MGIKPKNALDPVTEIERLVQRLGQGRPFDDPEHFTWWFEISKLFKARGKEIQHIMETVLEEHEVATATDTIGIEPSRTWHILRDTDVDMEMGSSREPGRIWTCSPYMWCDEFDRETLKYGYYELLGSVEVCGIDSFNIGNWDCISEAVMAAFIEGQTSIHMDEPEG
jgi:hypothetical protein